MKKIITTFFSLILITMLVISLSFTAQAASASLSRSASTVYRGDTFTISVSLSNDQPVSNGGIILSFDSSVFEITGGSCNVSGATLAEVSASRNGGVFVLQNDAVVSGTIFTINMRVKSGASFGTYKISGKWSLTNGSGDCSTNITVACKHNYGSASNVDATNHQSSCTICGEKKTEAHKWNSGTTVKEATCKDTGIKKLTCTACNATKEEKIPVNNNHKFGNWSKTSDNSHSHTCSVCGKKESSSHSWNNGTVLESATCVKTGSKKVTCTYCSATKTVTIPVTEHNYGTAVKTDDENHLKTCKDCGKETTEAHTYGSKLSHDENWHYQECTACGFITNQEIHVEGPEATVTTDQICTVCERILVPMGEHVHKFATEWTVDETGHYYLCKSCNGKDSAAPHSFDSDCDTNCDICGYEREPMHVKSDKYFSDESGHWYECVNCKEKLDFSEHKAGPEATIVSNQICTVCEYELAPIVPHDHVYDANGTLHSHLCVCGEAYEAEMGECELCKEFPWWIVCVIEAVVFGGVIAFLLLKKKKA